RSYVNCIRPRAQSGRFCWQPGVLLVYDGHMSDFETLNVNEVPDDAHILDVRDPYEFDAGHIPGAINIPMDQLPVRIEELDPDTDYRFESKIWTQIPTTTVSVEPAAAPHGPHRIWKCTATQHST